jgi:hypothetical protein
MVMVVGALALLMGVLSTSTKNITMHEQFSNREKNLFAAQGMLRAVFSEKWWLVTSSPDYDPADAALDATLPGSPPAFATSGSYGIMFGAPDTVTGGAWSTINDITNVPYVGRKFGDCVITDVRARWHASTQNGVTMKRYFVSIMVTAQSTPMGITNNDGTPYRASGDVPATVVETYELNKQANSPVTQFVALANNISCTFCHTSFDNVNNYFNNIAAKPGNPNMTAQGYTDAAAKFNTFGRAKVASLGTVQMRNNSGAPQDFGRFYPSDSELNGTFYTRGRIEDQAHQPIATIQPVALTGVQFGSLNSSDAIAGINMLQDTVTGALTPVGLTPAAVSGTGVPVQWGNLYVNYPTDPNKMADGQVPLDFPYPFADLDNNKLVTDNDVAKKLADNAFNLSKGLTTPNITGGISGGYAMVVPKGSTFSQSKLPVPGDPLLAASQTVGSSGVVDGNLILIGTKDNPVVINQQTIVKGDIIIKGYYTGVGTFWAQGNVYLPSDLQYKNQQLTDTTGTPLADAQGRPLEDFGKASAGKENLGGVVAGGTIVIGDWLTASTNESGLKPDGTIKTDAAGNPIVDSKGNPIQSSTYINNQPPDAFDPSQVAPFSDALGRPGREDGFPLVPSYQKADPTFQYTYFQLNPTTGNYEPKQTPLFSKNFTMSQMEIFNRDQWAQTQQLLPSAADGTFSQLNTAYDSTFVPRYYVLNRGDPVGAYVFGHQTTDATTLATDAVFRMSTAGGLSGTFWNDTTHNFEGGESSKIYDTITLGGATVDSSGTPLAPGTGSLLNNSPTHMVYAPMDPTKPADPLTNPDNSTLILSTDATKAQKAAVIAINPDWIPTDKMWNILLNEEWSRKSNDAASQAVYKGAADSTALTNRDGTPFRIDGMLYTNNAIFGIQRNRALAPQAPGDYQNAVTTVGTPYVPDTTQPGSWPTLPPVTSYQYDNYTVDQLRDNYTQAAHQDTYTYIPYTDQYTRQMFVDNYQQIQFFQSYTGVPYYDTYTRTMDVDNYNRQQHQDHYSEVVTVDVWKQPDYPKTTRTWTCYTATQYGPQAIGAVVQVSPPDTFVQPTVCGGQAVSAATYSDSVTTVIGATVSITEPNPVPAGYTLKLSTTPTTQTSLSAPYYGGAPQPATPAGWTYVSTDTVAQVTSTAAYLHGSVAPNSSPPDATWNYANTTGTVQTSNSATYYDSANPPAPPTGGWTKTGQVPGATQTFVSANYTGTPPAVPAGYTVTGTTSVTANLSTAAYYTSQTPPAAPAGWTFVDTTVTTQTSNSLSYADIASPPALPTPGWSKTGTTPGATITALSLPYYAAQPTVPAGYTFISTATTTSFTSSVIYYQGNPSPAVPLNWTYVNTTDLGNTNVQVAYGSAAPSPLAVKQAPSNPIYSYPAGTTAANAASDFRRYAKEQESSSRGRLMINGAVMAPDLGLLVTGRPSDPTGKYQKNLILNYDNRIVRLLELPSKKKYPWTASLIGWTRIDPNAQTP